MLQNVPNEINFALDLVVLQDTHNDERTSLCAIRQVFV